MKNEAAERPLTQQKKKFTKLVREKSLTALKHLSYDDIPSFLAQFEQNDSDGVAWTSGRLDPLIDAYFDAEHHSIRLDPEARNMKHTQIDQSSDKNHWKVTQILCDPDEKNDWVISIKVDLDASNIQKTPVFQLENLSIIS
jgi:hypothetical protein